MKNMIKTKIWMLAAVLVFVSGCDGFLSINDDPNNPTAAPAPGLVTSATFETSQNHYRMGSTTSYFTQYLASPNPSSSTDIHEPVSYGNLWFQLYSVLTDLSDLEVLAEEQDASEVLGVAKLLKAINLGLVADYWGDAPYTQAFFAETLNPEYDSDEELYDEIFTLIDDGIAELQRGNSAIVVGNEDFIYEGDADLWLKTGYFLRARYLNHLSETGQYDPQAVLNALDQAYDSTSDDAQVEYYDEHVNPWASVAISNAGLILGGWLSDQIIDYLTGETDGVADPRIDLYTDPNDNGEYVGTRNGAGRGSDPEQGVRSVLTTDTYYAARQAPILIATYFEQKFIEAEAALRAGDQGRAHDAYLEAIEAHMAKVGVPQEEIEDYLANPEIDPGAGNLTLDDVFKEKYIAMFLHPEAWVDVRRNDYDYEAMQLPANHNPQLNGEFIRRLAYPDSETQRNGANVPDIQLNDRLWWDQ